MPSNMLQHKSFLPGSKQLSAGALEFIPQNVRTYSELNRTSPSTAVMEVQKAIKSLSDVPEEFYEVLVPLVTELNKHVQSPSILKAVVQEIFETSVNTSQFRYSGARMCCYLSQHLLLKNGGGNFLKELIDRCLKEYASVSTAGGFQTLNHLMGFILFMGELLVCMKDVEEIRRAFPEKLEDLLMTLTSNQSTNAFRCVIQCLKLTGAILDELVPQAGELYLEIERFIDDSKIPESVQTQIRALLELRGRGWEQNADESKTRNKPEINDDEFLCDESGQEAWPDPVEPVYYGLNEGYLIEESEALENLKLNDDEANNENANVEYLVNGQPMDAETALAFESFIQQLPTIHNELQPDELAAASRYYADYQWPMDGWSTLPPSFAYGSGGFPAANDVPDCYGPNYDYYSYYVPLENPPPPPSGLITLQPGIPPGASVTVPPPGSYVPSMQAPGGSDGEVVGTSLAAPGIQFNPSSVNGTVDGILPSFSNPPSFGR